MSKILDAFDKPEDILNVPFDVVREAMEKPTKNFQEKYEKEKKEMENKLNQYIIEFQAEIEPIIQRGNMLFEAHKDDSDSESRKEYQDCLDNLSAEIRNVIGNMSIELNEEIHDFSMRNFKQYKEINNFLCDNVVEIIKTTDERFPEDCEAKEILFKGLEEEMEYLSDKNLDLTKNIRDDVKRFHEYFSSTTEDKIRQSAKFSDMPFGL